MKKDKRFIFSINGEMKKDTFFRKHEIIFITVKTIKKHKKKRKKTLCVFDETKIKNPSENRYFFLETPQKRPFFCFFTSKTLISYIRKRKFFIV